MVPDCVSSAVTLWLPLIFDKLGHENKPPWCQGNAKYRASFLWLCLFNQLPLISALHPLFLSFLNVMEEKSAHRQHPCFYSLLLRCPHLLVHLSTVVFLTLSVSDIRCATLSFFCQTVSCSVSFPHLFLGLSLFPFLYHRHVDVFHIPRCILSSFQFFIFVSTLQYKMKLKPQAALHGPQGATRPVRLPLRTSSLSLIPKKLQDDQ